MKKFLEESDSSYSMNIRSNSEGGINSWQHSTILIILRYFLFMDSIFTQVAASLSLNNSHVHELVDNALLTTNHKIVLSSTDSKTQCLAGNPNASYSRATKSQPAASFKIFSLVLKNNTCI